MDVSFEKLYKEYETTKNVCEFCDKYSKDDTATRFLLIRSLDKENLRELLADGVSEKPDGKIENLMKQVYLSTVTCSQILEYIKSQRASVLKKREEELCGISDILETLSEEKCGIRDDKIDTIVKSVVRNKGIKTKKELDQIIEKQVLPSIRRYIIWSYYNQNSNDIIELLFLRNSNIIPTLRKIHDIDFFIKIRDKIVPFDLKVTHISDEYFDLYSRGMTANTDENDMYDSYCVKNEEGELKQIKNFYKLHKKEWDLPNFGELSKAELIETLKKTNKQEALDFIQEMTCKRAKYVSEAERDLKPLEWWNYKYQGERLFCNNNRFFIFLAYRDQFEDGRILKGKIEEIEKKINWILDNLTEETLHTIQYHYTKAAELTGDYAAKAVSVIYTE